MSDEKNHDDSAPVVLAEVPAEVIGSLGAWHHRRFLDEMYAPPYPCMARELPLLKSLRFVAKTEPATPYVEAELLREGIERIISDLDVNPVGHTAEVRDDVTRDLQKLLDGVDAANSLAWLEAVDSIMGPVLELVNADSVWDNDTATLKLREAVDALPAPFREQFVDRRRGTGL